MHRAVPVVLILALSGCGYTGDPLPPALNIPERIVDLTGVQRGGKFVIAFTPSLMSTDKILLEEFHRVELRYGPIPEGDFSMDRWLAASREAKGVPAKAERTLVEVPVSDMVGRTILFAVRAYGPSGRPASWSNLLTLRAVEPPQTPAGFRAASHPQGVLLTWDRGSATADANWRVFRKGPDDRELSQRAVAAENRWIDLSVEEGKTYAYAVQLIVPVGAGADAESDLPEPVAIQPEDTFPPAVPAGLNAIIGVKTVELAWERNSEPDLAGYVILRALGNAPLARLDGTLTAPSFSDTTAESGKTYRYAVASIDRKNNVSNPSEPITITAP